MSAESAPASHLPFEAHEEGYYEEAMDRYGIIRADLDEAFAEASDRASQQRADEFAGLVASYVVSKSRANELRPSSTIPRSEREYEWYDVHIAASYESGRGFARDVLTGVGESAARKATVEVAADRSRGLNEAFERQRKYWGSLSGDVEDEVRTAVKRVLSGGGSLSDAYEAADGRIVNTGFDRARRIAHNEPGWAFNRALLEEYHGAGVTDVDTDLRWETAGDQKVCSECAGLSGTYPIGEAKEMMAAGYWPVHPLCRCIWLPS